MKKFTANSKLASNGGLETGETDQFRLAIERLQGFQIDPNRWSEIVSEYRSWEHAAIGTSRTNRRLQLLKIASERFPGLNLLGDASLVCLTLADVRKPGEVITAKLPSGQAGQAKIIRREITGRLSVHSGVF